ncbi:MAG: TRAP transporter large permease [Variibacter sp.]
MALYIVSSLFVLLALGVPVAFAIGIIGLGAIVFFQATSLTQLAQSQFANLDSFVLLAIPFFVLAGNVMVRGQLAAYLYGFMRALTRPISGGPAIGAVLASAIFGAMSGSSAAAAAALGRVTIPELDRLGFPRSFSAGVMAAGGTLSILIPPSIVFVIYGAMAQVSVADLFIAGVAPGIFLTILIGIVTFGLCIRNGWNVADRWSLSELTETGLKSIPALAMPGIVLGGIYGGFFTPTEAAAVSALYGLAVGLFVYRSLTLKDLPSLFAESARMTATVLIILAGALFIGMLSTLAGIPQAIVHAVGTLALSKWQFLLVVNLVLLVLGCFLDGITILTVVTPLLLPSLRALDVNLIHFAIILTVNIEIASITPPIGMNLFVISSISKTPLETVVRGVVPYIIVLALGLLIITYVPWAFLLG